MSELKTAMIMGNKYPPLVDDLERIYGDLIFEYQNVSMKILRLRVFLKDPKNESKVGHRQWVLMGVQRGHLFSYQATLWSRIGVFDEEHIRGLKDE